MPDEPVRFSCRSPDCWVKHQIFETGKAPSLCPMCGSRIIIDGQPDPLAVSAEMLADITDMERSLVGTSGGKMAAMLVIMAPILERNTTAMTRLAEAIERMGQKTD